ncbi:glutathione S-transferase T3-like [Tripterygium wilfordii]|uniref:glutathione S-transferase T3-like n=1 Tax=Tripterygium wilfordii TaxID=458696 RepID=UPI0018F844B9|nr:glutathione S-transferase T3-like [Tripterygium wilfordii]
MTRGKQKIEAQRRNAEKDQKAKGSQLEARAVCLKVVCPSCKMDSQAYFTNLLSGGSSIDGPFLTQNYGDPNEDSPTMSQVTNTSSNARKGRRGTNFAIEEDQLLISAYLNTSLDVGHENQQKLRAYWERIEKYFNDNKQGDNIFRTKVSLQHRWDKIQREVTKFCEHYAKIEGQHSDFTEQDKIMAAKQLFRSLEGHSFHFSQCWLELRHHPKWIMKISTKKAKNSKNASPYSSPPVTPDAVNLEEEDSVPSIFDGLEGPAGRKAVKESIWKGKTHVSDTRGSTMLQVLDEESINRENRFERTYKQQQELIDIEKQKYRLEESREEERIMTTDTTGMPPDLAKYYECRKAEILGKRGVNF